MECGVAMRGSPESGTSCHDSGAINRYNMGLYTAFGHPHVVQSESKRKRSENLLFSIP